MKESTTKLLADLMSDEEMAFLDDLKRSAELTIQRDRIVADFYLSKVNEVATNRKIESDRRSAIAMLCLTGALVVVGAIQVVAMFVV